MAAAVQRSALRNVVATPSSALLGLGTFARRSSITSRQHFHSALPASSDLALPKKCPRALDHLCTWMLQPQIVVLLQTANTAYPGLPEV